MADKQSDAANTGQDRKQSTDEAVARFESALGISPKGLDRDPEAMNRLVDMIEQADRFRGVVGAGTTGTYDAARSGQSQQGLAGQDPNPQGLTLAQQQAQQQGDGGTIDRGVATRSNVQADADVSKG